MDKPLALPTNTIVEDRGRQRAASVEAAKRFSSLRRRIFPTRDAAACAWADAMQLVTETFDVEVGSRLFAMAGRPDGATMIGQPVTGLEICSRSAFCSFPINDAGAIPGGAGSGYVHTHPWQSDFSFQDLSAAADIVKALGGAQEATAYLSLPDRSVFGWSSVHWSKYSVPGGPTYRSPASFAKYLHETVRRVR